MLAEASEAVAAAAARERASGLPSEMGPPYLFHMR
jgi:hypothetical protein